MKWNSVLNSFPYQNSYVNHDCHEKRDRKQSSLVNSKQHFRFDLKQIDILSEEFLKNPYPSTSRRQLIANQFHISEKTIMVCIISLSLAL